MSYKERIDRVIDFIGKHLDEELELDELCRIACFSKYHFHRLFTAYTGLPLMGYIKWLPLKKAAHQLIVHKEEKLLTLHWAQVLNLMSHLREPLNKSLEKTPLILGLNQVGIHGKFRLIQCLKETQK